MDDSLHLIRMTFTNVSGTQDDLRDQLKEWNCVSVSLQFDPIKDIPNGIACIDFRLTPERAEALYRHGTLLNMVPCGWWDHSITKEENMLLIDTRNNFFS